MLEDIVPGVVVETQAVGHGGVYWSQVKRVAGDRLELWAPRSGPWDLSFRIGRLVAIEARVGRDEILQLHGEVVGLEAESGGWFVVRILGKPHRSLQRRRELRIPANIPTELALGVGGAGQAEREGSGVVVNLSVSGCVVSTELDCGSGACVSMRMEMPEGTVGAVGRVISNVRVSKDGKARRFRWGVRFERLSDDADAALARYVYEYQRKHGVRIL